MLALLPPVLAGVLLAVDAAVAGDLLAALPSWWAAYLVLSAAVLLAILSAAYARRDNVTLSSAWLFLFCGMILLSLAELLEMWPASSPWIVDIFETTALVPLLIFVGYVSAPLRILVLDRRRTTLYVLIASAVILTVALLTLAPWLRSGGRPHFGRLLRVLKPELDALLLSPLALLLLALGAAQRAQPYLFVGLGLVLMLPSDLFSHYHVLSRVALHEQLAAILLFMSHLYVLVGALSCARAGGCRTSGEAGP